MFLNNYMPKNISPHVQIYKFPVTAISSIATRISGAYLSGLFLGYGCLKLINKEDQVTKIYNERSRFEKFILHQSCILPMTYHSYGGMRHFIWDYYPKLLTNSKVAKSSYLLFGLTLGTSMLLEKILV